MTYAKPATRHLQPTQLLSQGVTQSTHCPQMALANGYLSEASSSDRRASLWLLPELTQGRQACITSLAMALGKLVLEILLTCIFSQKDLRPSPEMAIMDS